MRAFLTFGVALVFAACSRTAETRPARPIAVPDTLWLIAPEPSGDAVHASDSEASLRARYGSANVVPGEVHLGEGEMASGTILFPHDPARRLTVLWGDTIRRERAERVSIGGSPTRWAVYPGVSIGTSLRALEALNGRPFELLGFGWDYAGTVVDWKNGRLDQLWPRQPPDGLYLVTVRLAPDSAADPKVESEVAGDRVFPSDRPAMRALNPTVYDLFVTPR